MEIQQLTIEITLVALVITAIVAFVTLIQLNRNALKTAEESIDNIKKANAEMESIRQHQEQIMRRLSVVEVQNKFTNLTSQSMQSWNENRLPLI